MVQHLRFSVGGSRPACMAGARAMCWCVLEQASQPQTALSTQYALSFFLDPWININSRNNKPECCGGFVGDLRHWLCPRLLLHWFLLTKLGVGLSWFSLFRTLSHHTLDGVTVLHNEYVPECPLHSSQLWCHFFYWRINSILSDHLFINVLLLL